MVCGYILFLKNSFVGVQAVWLICKCSSMWIYVPYCKKLSWLDHLVSIHKKYLTVASKTYLSSQNKAITIHRKMWKPQMFCTLW